MPANTNQAIAIIRGTQSVFLHQFLLFALTSIATQEQANEEARGGAMNNISLDDVRSLRLPIPPLCEQKRLSAWLFSECPLASGDCWENLQPERRGRRLKHRGRASGCHK